MSNGLEMEDTALVEKSFGEWLDKAEHAEISKRRVYGAYRSREHEASFYFRAGAIAYYIHLREEAEKAFRV